VGSEQGDFLGVAAAVDVFEGFVCLGHIGGCAERLDRPHPGPLPQARGREEARVVLPGVQGCCSGLSSLAGGLFLMGGNVLHSTI
jgi:hypothetical protein